MTGDELHNGAETGPVDRDGARRTKSKHSTRMLCIMSTVLGT